MRFYKMGLKVGEQGAEAGGDGDAGNGRQRASPLAQPATINKSPMLFQIIFFHNILTMYFSSAHSFFTLKKPRHPLLP
jgi:hypothetical protein